MTTHKEIFAKNLQEMLDYKNETRIEFAKAIGVTPTAVNDWLHAKRYPRQETLERIAQHFNCDKIELITITKPSIQKLTPKEVGIELQKLLVEHGISPPELDERAEIKAGTTAKIIKGKYEPHIDVAIKIATVLDIPASLLLGVQEDAQAISRQRFRTRLYHEIPDLILNDDEITEIINYIKYLISKRK